MIFHTCVPRGLQVGITERKEATRHCCFSQSELNRGRYSMRWVLYSLPGSGERSRLTDIVIPFKNWKICARSCKEHSLTAGTCSALLEMMDFQLIDLMQHNSRMVFKFKMYCLYCGNWQSTTLQCFRHYFAVFWNCANWSS